MLVQPNATSLHSTSTCAHLPAPVGSPAVRPLPRTPRRRSEPVQPAQALGRREASLSTLVGLSSAGSLLSPPPSLSVQEPLPMPAPTPESIGDLVPYTNPAGLFSLLVPSGWAGARGLDSSTGILASWYNPNEPGAETLAVFSTNTPAQNTRELGTAKDLTYALADAAPNSIPLGYREYLDERSQVYYTVKVEFDGSTAGKFGAAIEWRTNVARNGTLFFLRITTTRYRYLAYKDVVDRIEKIAGSFRLYQDCIQPALCA